MRCQRNSVSRSTVTSTALVLLFTSCLATIVAANSKVTSAPHIFEQPTESEIAYKPGEEVKLVCIANSESQPTYAWKKDGVLIDFEALRGRIVMLPGVGTISIPRPSILDDGVYQCLAGNALGKAASSKITLKAAVLQPFRSISQAVAHTVDVGRSLTLRCSPPFGYPKGSVYWGISRPGYAKLEAIENNDRVVLDYDGNLHFTNVVKGDDSGNRSYSCAVFNGHLRASVQGDDQLIRARSTVQGHLRFSNVALGDSLGGDSYVCIANNPFLRSFVQGDDQKVRPNVAAEGAVPAAPTVMWTSPRRDVALKGRSKLMKCIFAGFPTPRVTWKRVDGKQDRSRMTIEGHGTEIEIPNVDFDDGGTYQCSGSNGLGPVQSVNLTLVIHSMPYWRNNKPPTDKQVDEDEDSEFECHADGNPRPNITWSINGVAVEDLPPDSRRSVETNRIRYATVTTRDNAVVQCVATNEHGHILANAVLTVTAAAPTFTTTPQDKKIVKGQNATFSCRAHGAPKPRLSWHKGPVDSQTPVSGNRFVMHSSGDLEVMDAMVSDSGDYNCEAENKFDKDSVSARLIVREPTVIRQPPRSQMVNVGDDVTLDCDAVTDTEEKLAVEWRRDGKAIDFQLYTHMSVDPQTYQLTIKQSRVVDTARFSCHAGNGLDAADSEPATITVRDRPNAPSDVKVSCSNSPSTVSWVPGADNNDPVIEYVVYIREGLMTSSGTNPSSDDFKEAVRVPAVSAGGDDRVTAEVNVSPWRSYEFRIVARNGLGDSDPSPTPTSGGSHRCVTPQTSPLRNPSGVCTQLRAIGQLVIVWQPVAESEHNGKGFYYLVKYKLTGTEGEPQTTTVDDPTRSEVVIHQLQTFSQYEISVQSANSIGVATTPVTTVLGYSGEGRPLEIPSNLHLKEDSLNSTHAEFAWDPVDTSPERVRGFFRGYRITMWRTSDPNTRRFEDVVLREPVESCSPGAGSRRRRHTVSLRRHLERRAVDEDDQSSVSGSTNQLWPYSRIKASVSVLNRANVGHESDAIEFETPEGVAGPVADVRISERGSNHLVVDWNRPVEPNGIIRKYYVTCRVAPPNVGRPLEIVLDNSTDLTQVIPELESQTVYQIEVAAETFDGGRGPGVIAQAETLVAALPDKPLIGSIEPSENSALVSFGPSSELPATNPGTTFYVEYIDADNADQGNWERTDPVKGRGGAINVTGLQPGKKYTFRVVAMNGIGDTTREMRSDPHTVQVGPDNYGVITYPPPVEHSDPQPIVDEAVVMKRGTADWFIILIIIIIVLLIILFIVCIVHRNRGEMYPVQEKEKLRGRDPLAPDDAPFGEYTAGGHPDLGRSQGSLDSDEKPLDSETDSLGEYEDPEASKFNEDGSFIGLYSGQKSRQPKSSNASPSAVNTFV